MTVEIFAIIIRNYRGGSEGAPLCRGFCEIFGTYSVSKLLCSTITCYNVQNLNCGIIIKPMILIGLAMRLAEFAV